MPLSRLRSCLYAPDAWVDESKTQIGYQISLTKHFYKPVRLRELSEIVADIRALEKETEGLLDEILGMYEKRGEYSPKQRWFIYLDSLNISTGNFYKRKRFNDKRINQTDRTVV